MGQSARTLADLLVLARWYVDQLSAGALVDTSTTQFDLTTAVQFGYEQFARDTRCFPVNYTLAATSGTASYAYSLFGTSSAGGRIFELRGVWFDEQRLARVSLDRLDNLNPHWRFESAGTPAYWMPYGESTFQVYPKPNSMDNLYIEGWQTPDLTAFDTSTDVPLIHVSDRYLIAIQAALYTAQRLVGTDNINRLKIIEAQYAQGIERACERINSAAETLIFAQDAATSVSEWPEMATSVTNVNGP